jgi:hypothetical protein
MNRKYNALMGSGSEFMEKSMAGSRIKKEHGVLPDSPPIFVTDEADAETAIDIKPDGVADSAPATSEIKAPDTGKQDIHLEMMGDGTEEQNLSQRGNPQARIQKDEVGAAFGEKAS